MRTTSTKRRPAARPALGRTTLAHAPGLLLHVPHPPRLYPRPRAVSRRQPLGPALGRTIAPTPRFASTSTTSACVLPLRIVLLGAYPAPTPCMSAPAATRRSCACARANCATSSRCAASHRPRLLSPRAATARQTVPPDSAPRMLASRRESRADPRRTTTFEVPRRRRATSSPPTLTCTISARPPQRPSWPSPSTRHRSLRAPDLPPGPCLQPSMSGTCEDDLSACALVASLALSLHVRACASLPC